MKACRFALAAGGSASVPAQRHAFRASAHAQSRALSAAAAAEVPKRTFQLLTPELAEGTASCVAETFSHKDEPLTWALNLRRHHWHSLTIPFIERAANCEPAEPEYLQPFVPPPNHPPPPPTAPAATPPRTPPLGQPRSRYL